jgi:predicted helicase
MGTSQEYLNSIIKKFNTGHANEHAHRAALELYFENLTKLNVINDPKRSEYGAPDYVFLKGKVTVAYAEAKDIGVSLKEVEKGEQLGRYFGYSNLILTDYLEFRFFRNGQKYGEPIKIAEVKNGEIQSLEGNFSLLEDTIKEFILEAKEPIKSGVILAKVMAGKARRIRDNIKKFFKENDDHKNESLMAIYNIIKKFLLADLDYDKFADMYAQTVVYGLFAARYYDKTKDTFSRQEARDLVPKSNPFLFHFFDHIAGSSFDERLEFIVNELCEEFAHADVQAIVHDYYKVEKDSSRDPIIHFYEDFLKEYDPKARMDMGIFYTPLPVVNFIVRAIDDILKKDFNLKGLVDSSKIQIDRVVQGKKSKHSVHKVQILDPATGTGTFLNQVVEQIKKEFSGQEGRWSKYVSDDLIPRLHGFEIMMASYTIAHLKLSTMLRESGGYVEGSRLGIYLTNSLENTIDRYGDGMFAGLGLDKAITEESRQANKIKNDLPIMVVLGNPPYSGESMNPNYKDNDVYKFEPGTTQKLKERNSKWLNDDYVKFIRLGESMIEKNGTGILAYITNHAYLDNPTFRGMRYRLLQTFDQLYVIDLHGNTKKKETSPDGSLDQNVFDIQQGVAILIGIKTQKNKKGKLARLHLCDIYGSRSHKFAELNKGSISNLKFKRIVLSEPFYLFKNIDLTLYNEYKQGFSVAELFKQNSVGIVTSKDAVFIADNKTVLEKQIVDFFKENNIESAFDENKTEKISYRPLDNKVIYYDPKLIERAREKVMKNFINKNIGLVAVRQVKAGDNFCHVFISDKIVESTYISNKTSEIGYVFPLYIYSEDGKNVPNFNKEVYGKIIQYIKSKLEPENVLDYIYAVLHSPSYREKYKEFLKIDFPRVPYPKNEKQFFALAKLGEELRGLHLLESPKVDKFITTYPEAGDDLVEKVKFEEGKVYINKTQHFGGVPEAVWNFYIGGYQPAQKWLKDRKGRTLNNEDIEHYQKMIVSMNETIRIMGEIDKIEL